MLNNILSKKNCILPEINLTLIDYDKKDFTFWAYSF